MSWILPSVREVLPILKRRAGTLTDRHNAAYWRAYHQKHLATRRPYLAAKAREYRAAKRAK